MIHVLAIITAKPGKRAEVLEAFHANMPAVHAEVGCIEYGPAVDARGLGDARFGPDTFVAIEKWESPEALAAHVKSAHMAAYAARTRDMVASRAVHVLESAALPAVATGPLGTDDKPQAHIAAVHANGQ